MLQFKNGPYSKKIDFMTRKISDLHQELTEHPIYKSLNTKENLKIFMEHHVFAVWDFMTILKALQIKLTCTTIPWRPSHYPKEVVRFINSIVLDEESDLDHNGQANDHFSMYVQAMSEVKADVKPVLRFTKDFNCENLNGNIKDFVEFNLKLSSQHPAHVIAGVFYFGREKIIPAMFSKILEELEASNEIAKMPALEHYLKRHIELDAEDHGPLAEELLISCCNQDAKTYLEALTFGLQACLLRKKLYDSITEKLETAKTFRPRERWVQNP